MFSCGFSMTHEKTYPNGRIIVWENNFQYLQSADSIYYSCKDEVPYGDAVVDAYTMTWDDSGRAVIRFCPHFLQFIVDQRFTSTLQINPMWVFKNRSFSLS